MIEGETPEEYQRRLKREQMQRYRERKASGETGTPGRIPYTPGPGEESREDRRKRQNREASARYHASDFGQETAEAYRQTEAYKESQAKYEAKPERKASNAPRKRQQRESGSVPMNYPKDEGSPQSPHDLEREPFQPQGTPSELDKAAANREMVQKNERAQPFKEKGGRPKKGENVKLWWRKLW